MAPEMLVDVLGRIESGQEGGRYVFVQDDTKIIGGFLILTGATPELSVDGADSWVENREAVDRFAEESAWVIRWLGESSVGDGPHPSSD